MRVFDCFPFLSEFDVLDVHLAELHDVVDTFVLVEATTTHTGHPKPTYFSRECVARYQQYNIAYRIVELQGPPSGDNPGLNWGREAAQRNAILDVLAELKADDDDIILSLDVDEIPTTTVIEEYRSRQDICCIKMPTYHYNLNTRLETPTADPKICRYRDFKAIGPSQMRYMQTAYPLHVLKGGWHLSFMGGVDKIIEKVKAYAHYDDREPRMQQFISRENVEASIREKKSIYMRPDIKYFDEPNPVLPNHIAENRQRFIDLGWLKE